MQYHKEDVPLTVIGMEVGLVVMVVQICHAVRLDMSISYLVEDDSDRMESTVPPLRNTFVKIRVIKSSREQKMVTVYRLSTITSRT